MWCSDVAITWVTVMVLSVEYVYACLIVNGYKRGETRDTRHVAACKGIYVALYAQQQQLGGPGMHEMLTMLREVWPDIPHTALACEYKAGTVWALVEIGDTHSKSCYTKKLQSSNIVSKPCAHECAVVEGQVWCPARRDLCIGKERKFSHATQLLAPIMLNFPVQVSPMAGLFHHKIPLSAVPTDRMTAQQFNLWQHTTQRLGNRDRNS